MTATDLQATDFREFFTALWDRPPFAWQQALAERVLESDSGGSPWPEAIALPTASGKTACMDVAVFALAAQASRLAQRQTITAPRRIFFVVDRRVIVDEAHERAKRLVKKLERAEDGVLGRVADNLRQIAHGATTGFGGEHPLPLAAHLLRGGMYRSDAWARNPLQPTVVASTVDQIGSRLLFRAYGRGSGTWPIYAGLIANDSLILLDEAHCVQPFLQTLQAVRCFQTWAQDPLRRCFHPVVMSATPPPDLTDRFDDQSGERHDPQHRLGRRQLAHKPAVLQRVEKARGKQATSVFAQALADAARELVDERRRAIVVFVNRVATARETHRLLAADDRDQAVLLTGRMRPVDKDDLVDRLKVLHSDRSGERSLTKPLMVVATQTLEVGADLDFDGLVTECASLDALRQRFGRLNRMGRPIEARAAILVRGDQADATEVEQAGKKKTKEPDDPVYGNALSRTWAWLNQSKDENGEVDFGIAHLDSLLPQGGSLAALNAPSHNAPVMLPAHVDCWAQTSPQPDPSPDVALFLHGLREGAADVQVCWRADVDLTNERAQSDTLESLSLCPPSSSETLPVPIGVFKRWLAGKDMEDDSADLEGVWAGAGTDEEGSSPVAHAVIRWRGAETDHKDVTAKPTDIHPGDVIVIPVDHPGPWRQLGDLPTDLDDVGDAAYRLARAKPILRLHRKLVDAWPVSMATKETAFELLNDLERKYEDDPDEVVGTVDDLLTELSETPETFPGGRSRLFDAARELEAEFSSPKLRPECRIIGGRSLVVVGRRPIPELLQEADHFSDEDDAVASGTSHRDGRPVRLSRHLPGVGEFAGLHAVGCGLPDELVDAVTRAGRLHDLGKADPRFQALLQGGARWLGGEPLAKSFGMPKTSKARLRASGTSRYPKGGRHELLSVRMAESVPALLPERQELRDLTLHLIASHHGHCRPFAPVVCDEQDIPVVFEMQGHRLQWSGATGLERLDSGVADRYWRLVRRYGWWGLAWLEALLRLADWRRSEWEEAHGGDE